jgi:hypothetical protein
MISLPRNCQIWLKSYIKDRCQAAFRPRPERVWVMFADHFEPLWGQASEKIAIERTARWASGWPRIASKFCDSLGRPPQYTFFYPEEEYRPHLLDPLQSLAEAGIADVEVHLHHDGEGEQNFVDRIGCFTETLLARHGLLRKLAGRIVFGFIHGNWALDNSRPDGRMCGLNNELTLLRNLGCYADFTMPSAGSPTQASFINSIYWATDDPCAPKSYDTGVPVVPGRRGSGDLLMIPGPLGWRWAERVLPRLENGELACYDLPTPSRIKRWLELAPRIGTDVFLKLHTHGAQERHSSALLSGGLEAGVKLLIEECSRAHYQLYFVSAWEMRQAIAAIEAGQRFVPSADGDIQGVLPPEASIART